MNVTGGEGVFVGGDGGGGGGVVGLIEEQVEQQGGGVVGVEEQAEQQGGGGGGGGVVGSGDGRAEEEGGGGAAVDGSNAVKVVVGAITETVIVGSTSYNPIAKSLPGALSVAYAAFFLTVLLFLAILLLFLRLPRPSGSGGSVDDAGEGRGSVGGRRGGGAVEFAKRAAMAVVLLVPLVALAAKACAVLSSKAN